MTTYSDLHIPALTDILDRAGDALGSAYRLQDDASARQLERLITNIPQTRLCWILGALHIASPSGGAYRVTRAGCDCPNGQAGRRQCWHVATFELLLDMLDTEAETRDMLAECVPPGTEPGDDLPDDYPPSARSLGARLATARRTYAWV